MSNTRTPPVPTYTLSVTVDASTPAVVRVVFDCARETLRAWTLRLNRLTPPRAMER